MVASASAYMPPWLLALIVLLVSCAVGAYYVGGEWAKGLVPEGFFSGSLQSYTRRQAQAKCDRDFYTCTGAGTDVKSCTTIYNTCTAAATAANTDISTVAPAASNTNQTSSSAPAAIAAARAAGNAGNLASGNTTTSAQYQAEQAAILAGIPITQTTAYRAFLLAHPMLADRARYQIAQAATPNSISPTNTDAYKAFLDSLATRTVTDGSGGAPPTAAQLLAAQGDGGSGTAETTGNYVPNQTVIPPHITPAYLQSLITARLASDAGTQAQVIQQESVLTPSVRSQIRDDIKKAIREEIAAVNNEYEIQYD